MIEHRITTKIDLESQDIAQFVQMLNHFSNNDVIIRKGDHRINAKSILGMYALEIQKDEEVNFMIDGSEEQKIKSEINHFFDSLKEY